MAAYKCRLWFPVLLAIGGAVANVFIGQGLTVKLGVDAGNEAVCALVLNILFVAGRLSHVNAGVL